MNKRGQIGMSILIFFVIYLLIGLIFSILDLRNFAIGMDELIEKGGQKTYDIFPKIMADFFLNLFLWPVNVFRGRFCGYVSPKGDYYKEHCIIYIGGS